MPTTNVVPLLVTAHALERFLEQWECFNPDATPSDPLRTLSRLLNAARREKIDPFRFVHREAKHRSPAEYWENSGWRFVIVRGAERCSLVTVERTRYSVAHHMKGDSEC